MGGWDTRVELQKRTESTDDNEYPDSLPLLVF